AGRKQQSLPRLLHVHPPLQCLSCRARALARDPVPRATNSCAFSWVPGPGSSLGSGRDDTVQPIGSILARRTYSPQSLIALSNSSWAISGVLMKGSPPNLLRNALVSSEDTICTNHWLILSITGFGVPVGTIAAHQPVRSIGMPISVMVGRSALAASRVAVLTARILSLP